MGKNGGKKGKTEGKKQSKNQKEKKIHIDRFSKANQLIKRGYIKTKLY